MPHSGFQAQLFGELGIEVVGIDISPPLIKYAKKLTAKQKPRVSFQVGDMREIDFDSEFNAVVILGCSFGFGSDAENYRTLENIVRALKPGGRLLLTGQHPYAASNRSCHGETEWVVGTCQTGWYSC